MGFLKDIQDKIIIGRWRFLNLKELSGTTKQLAIDGAGNLGIAEAVEPEIAWSDITDKPETFDPSVHQHNASDVNLDTYTIGTAGDIVSTDTLLQAIGKLEARIVVLETTP